MIFWTKIKFLTNKISKGNIISSIILLFISLSFCYLIPFYSINSTFFQLYVFIVFKKWIGLTIYAIKDYKDIKEDKLIVLFNLSFIPMAPVFSEFCNTFKCTTYKTTSCSIVWEPTVRPAEIRKNFGTYFYIESFNNLFASFSKAVDQDGITQKELRHLLLRTMIKMQKDDFNHTLDYHDIMLLKRLSHTSEYSRESRALLRGLSNNYPATTRENHATTAWSKNEGEKRAIYRDLHRMKAEWFNKKR